MQDTNHILFIMPDTSSFPSGGNEYNKRLTDSLRDSGTSVEICTIEATSGQYHDRLVIWDSLYLFDQKKTEQGTHYLLVHHLESLYPPKGWTSLDFFNQKERAQLNAFDGFITSSPYTTSYLSAANLGHKPILTITPAIDFIPKINLSLPQCPLKIILVANIIKRKGILPFLQQLSAKKANNIDIKIIGSPDFEPAYAQKCIQLGQSLNNIHFLGSLPQKEVIRLYEQSDLFISTSYMETYGMAIQEAVAHGLPLLLLDGGNVKNHLQNNNGLLCQTIETLIDHLLILSKSPMRIGELKHNALELAQIPTRTWSDAALELVTFFHKNNLPFFPSE